MAEPVTAVPTTALFLEKIKTLSNEFSSLPESLSGLPLPEVWGAISARLGMEQLELAEKIAELSGLQDEKNLLDADLTLVAKVPKKTALSTRFIPLRKEGNAVVIAAANPFDPGIEQVARFSLGNEIICHIASPDNIELALARAYSVMEEKKKSASEKSSFADEGIPKLAMELMQRALKQHASDMHVQPYIGGWVARIRVDGQLRKLVLLPDSVAEALVRFFKAHSHMDPTNHLVPQDGRMEIDFEEQKVDLRVSTLPLNQNREKLVVRFLVSSSTYSLATTGLSLQEMHTLQNMASNPSGVVLLCGPTGSGKTTTLYSVLAELNKESISITTIENPVEYSFPGMSQTEINEAAGMTFSRALRSILRQDPDVILVGEIRDEETAQIAMQAALTGHLLFSTLHTNDALGSIPRLLDLGILPVILSQALAGVVSQRLMRHLCENCKVKVSDPLLHDEEMFKQVTHVAPGYRPEGCEACGFSGFKGRVVVTEMVEINSAMAALIASGESDPGVLRTAAGHHATTLYSAAARRVISGDTTAAEAARVLGRPFWLELAAEYKTELPEMPGQGLASSNSSNNETQVLLIGDAGAFDENWVDDFKHAWIKIHRADSPESANTALKQHTDTGFVILDLPDSLDNDQLVQSVAEYRVAIAWSSLPAVLLLPADRKNLKEMLVTAGATSRLVEKPVDAGEIVDLIHMAVNEHLDYRWEG